MRGRELKSPCEGVAVLGEEMIIGNLGITFDLYSPKRWRQCHVMGAGGGEENGGFRGSD